MKFRSVMIVDDNEDDRYLLKRLIKKSKIKCKIYEAVNGKEALDFLSNFEEGVKEYKDDYPPSIIFLDINMPVMGGFEFLEEFEKLRQRTEGLHSVVFAMFTSSARAEDVEKAESFEFVEGFITKGSLTAESLKESLAKKYSDITFED